MREKKKVDMFMLIHHFGIVKLLVLLCLCLAVSIAACLALAYIFDLARLSPT